MEAFKIICYNFCVAHWYPATGRRCQRWSFSFLFYSLLRLV